MSTPGFFAKTANAIAPIAYLVALVAVALSAIGSALLKLQPAWNPAAKQAEDFIGILSDDSFNPSTALAVIGIVQLIAGVTLLIPRTRTIAVYAFLALLALVVVFAVLHLGEVVGSGGKPTAGGLALAKALVLTLCGVAFAARGSAPAAKDAAPKG